MVTEQVPRFIQLHGEEALAPSYGVIVDLLVEGAPAGVRRRRGWRRNAELAAWVLFLDHRGGGEAGSWVGYEPERLRRQINAGRATWQRSVRALRDVGVVTLGGAGGVERVRFEPEALAPSPVLGALDGSLLLSRLEREPAAHAVCWAVLRVGGAPLEFTPAPLDVLVRESGYSEGSVRAGLRTLERSGLLVVRPVAGAESSLRFATEVFGGGGGPVEADRSEPAKGPRPAGARPAEPASRAPERVLVDGTASESDGGVARRGASLDGPVTIDVGGSRIDVPAGGGFEVPAGHRLVPRFEQGRLVWSLVPLD